MTRYARIVLAAAVLASHPIGAAQAALPENGRILLAKRTYVSTINPDGSGRRNLARGKFAGALWSPDKSKIAYREGSDCCVKSLWMMGAGGKNKVKLVEETSDGFSWAPSMRRLAYEHEVEGDVLNEACTGIWIVHVATKTSRLLTEIPNCEDVWGLSWSPRGDYILFELQDAEQRYQIHSVDVSTGAVVQLTDGPGENLAPVWSPDGSRIAFESTRDHENRPAYQTCFLETEIYTMRPDGSRQRRVTRGNDNYECGAHWLPNGSGLVVTRQIKRSDAPDRARVLVVRVDGSQLIRLTPRRLFRVWASDVSPDGNWVLYTTFEWREEYRESRWFVYRVPTDGGKRKRILGPTVWSQPVAW